MRVQFPESAERTRAHRFMETSAHLLMSHMKNRACLRANGEDPAKLQRLSAHVSNCHAMFQTAVARYLATL